MSVNLVKGVALVTGAAQGLGRAIALRLATDGYDVALTDLPSKHALLEDLMQVITSTILRRSVIVLGDVSSEPEVKNIISAVATQLGSLDVMVANAGVLLPNPLAPLVDTSVESLDAIFSVNVRGVFLCYKYAAHQMIAQGRGGRIIGASSIAGISAWPGGSLYSASKFAVRGLTQAAAQELGPHKITVNAYAPGMIVTPMTQIIDTEKVKESQSCALGYPGAPADVAAVVSFLASADAHFITGQTITVDGGRMFS
ncbi:short chain oxidoreductase [Mycena galericulata]|nr:short chain oxidoreductase [Mycena galericulata]